MTRSLLVALLAIALPVWASAIAQGNSDDPETDTQAVSALHLDEILQQPGTRWSIPEVARRAVSMSPRVAVADDRLQQAEATTEAARAVALPRVLLSARYTRLSHISNEPLVPFEFDPEAARALAGQVTDPAAQALWSAQIDLQAQVGEFRIEIPQNQYTLSALLEYPISRLFFEILPGIRESEEGQKTRRYEVEVARNAVALRLIEIFMNHARARGALAVATLALSQADGDARRAETLLRNGLGNRPDVLQFHARKAQAERQRAQTDALAISTANALRTLLVVEGEGPFAFAESFTSIPPQRIHGTEKELIARAWEQRDEMKAVEHLVRSREHMVRRERGSMSPDLGIAAVVEYANPNALFIPPVSQFRTSWRASAVLRWSPDHTWAASRSRNRAEAQAAEARDHQEELRNLIRIEVVEAYAAYRASFVAMAAAKKQLNAAEAAYEGRKRGYELGVGTATELIAAEVGANRARLALVNAAAALYTHEYALRRALGEHLWQ